MAQVAAAGVAQHLGALAEERIIRNLGHAFIRGGLPKAGPAGARVEFVRRIKEAFATARSVVGAGALILLIFP